LEERDDARMTFNFKEGDKVRVINGKPPSLPNGNVYTIESSYLEGDEPYVRLVEKPADSFYAFRFEPVNINWRKEMEE
jgi:hypothetical protein